MTAPQPYQRDIEQYFTRKAAAYDDVDSQAYWRLSDDLLWRVLSDDVLPSVPDDLRLLDAGGGTGRWTHRILTARPRASAVIVDLTAAMLAEASAKAEAHGYADRVTTVNAALEDEATVLGDATFDVVTCFHNVIGFVSDPRATIAALAQRLDQGGVLAVMFPNAAHAAFFNIARGRLDEARRCIVEGRGRFTDDMPDLSVFHADEAAAMFTDGGLSDVTVLGFPALIYPGVAETRLHGQSGHLADLLEDADGYARVFDLEAGLLHHPWLAARGNNILAVGRRR